MAAGILLVLAGVAYHSSLGCPMVLDDEADILGNPTRRYDEAIADFQRVLELQPDDPLATRNLGAVMLQEGRFADAVPLLIKASAAEPSSSAIQYSLGLAYQGLGKQEEAKRCFDEARRLAPGLPPVPNPSMPP